MSHGLLTLFYSCLHGVSHQTATRTHTATKTATRTSTTQKTTSTTQKTTSRSRGVFVLDPATGNVLSNVTITGMDSITSVVSIGTNVFVYGVFTASISVGTVSVNSPPSGHPESAALLRFTASGNTLTASAGTWIGTDNEYHSEAVNMVRAYNVTGYPNAFYVAVDLTASNLKTGIGYTSAQLHPFAPNSSYQYTVSKSLSRMHCIADVP